MKARSGDPEPLGTSLGEKKKISDRFEPIFGAPDLIDKDFAAWDLEER